MARLQAHDLEAKWGAGGSHRQVMSAITAAAAGNVSGSGSEFVQSTMVNLVQSKAAQGIKQLADDYAIAEGSAAHAALHAINACAGAAMGGSNCGAAALGAASASVIGALLAEGQGGADKLTNEQKEARQNLVATLVTSLEKTAELLEKLEFKSLTEKQQAIARYLDEAGTRGGLTESEIAVLGIIYAANATLFPTSALDIIPGAGKAVSKSGELIKAGVKADDAAKVAAEAARAGKDIPYNSRTVRNDLEDKYGADNVVSTTVPPTNMPNVKLAGQSKTIELLDGSTVRVVFNKKGYPIFDDVSKYDTRLPVGEFRAAGYQEQMRMASKELRDQINSGNISASQFTPAQLKAIQTGSSKIPDLTWHHHQDTGRMQLVPEKIHGKVTHVGWESMSKGQ